MKRSVTNWSKKFRRRIAACAVGGSTALSSAACYAAKAFDSASDPVYADGWQAGDNGGSGFTPWNFDAAYIFQGTNYAYAQAGFKMIDDGLKAGTQFSNPFNDIGRAWTLGTTPDDDGAPHVGRGFPALQINDTLRVVFDNPDQRKFFKGYFIRLNGSTDGANGNICNKGNPCSPAGTPVAKMGFDRFEYNNNNGEWNVDDNDSTPSGLFDTDTAAAGATFQVTRTGEDTYDLLVRPFGPAAEYSASRTFTNFGTPVDWVEFVFFNPVSDLSEPPIIATDFYIRSMDIFERLPGDANFDGKIDADDYFLIDKGFILGLQGFQNGDFDGNGTIDADDYFIIDRAFLAQGPAAAAVAAVTVPEPTSALVLGIALMAAGRRRRFTAGRRVSNSH